LSITAEPRAPIGITVGDPAGIGPELVEQLWQRRGALPRFVAIAPEGLLPPALPQRTSGPPCPAEPGRPTPQTASAAFAALAHGVDLVLAGQLSALVTAPVAKAGLHDVGFHWPGQTEYLAHRCGVDTDRTAMMLAGPQLRTVPMTIHCALSAVPRLLTPDRVVAQAETVDRALRHDFGLARPRLVLAGLNPHAGEGGAFGNEEQATLTPAVARLRAAGIDMRGPLPADSLFHATARAGYDAVLCCYHDQALIPVKTLAFDETVNITLGLPIIRTAPDHGTAFDIAGRGLASPASMIAALHQAAACVAARAPAR